MEEKKVVVDASVVAKWFLEEKFSSKALELRNDYIRGLIRIVAPSLLEFEVLNALKYSGVYNVDELEEIGVSLNKYGFELYELESVLKELTIKIAFEHNVTIYDASYVALAQHLNTVLYTADNELVQKFPKTAIHVGSYVSTAART
ncbi:MAG: PIN domain nuclease [Desulfurococcales archaeon ex4484_217_2]|nr:MAG: PIN domain nuclease [Desulfurococcales archaeon ex4484_217_2]